MPFNNPTEKYNYDWLPWPCKPAKIQNENQGVGGDLSGERVRESLHEILFLRATEKQSLCGKKKLSEADVDRFINAIKNEFQYELFVDDLPVLGRVGFVGPAKSYFLITHRHFNIQFHHDQIITANISSRLQPTHYVELIPGKPLDVHFTYSVSWTKTNIKYADRFEWQMHSNPSRYQVEAHWLWVLNSSLLVVLLTGLLSMILLRTLKNDVARYMKIPELEQTQLRESREGNLLSEVDESGWKRIQFDVFRAPPYPYLFSSIIGVGAQILMVVIFLLVLAVIGYFYPGNHGRTYVAAMLLYSLTAYVAGYIGSSKLKEVAPESHDWMISCLLTASLFVVPFIVVFAVINTTAVVYESSIALPFATIMAMILLWAFVTFPLTAFGAYRGKKVEVGTYPCHVRKIPKPLPSSLAWYYHPILMTFGAGFLPFMAIYVEVHTIFMSVWGHQVYSLFGILLLTFCILLVVTSFVVILMAYFQLTAEDYRWWWASLFRGASCGFFMYAYAWYYCMYSTRMSGTLQLFMFFGYTLVMSYGFCLMLAAVAHWSSRWFVIKIYSAIKSQ